MVSSNLRNYAKQVARPEKVLDRRLILKVVGVTFEGRQELVARLENGTPLKLERDRRNEYDSYAVQVLAELGGQWEQVGYIPRQASRKIASHLDKGEPLITTVHRVLGGGESSHTGEKLSYGLDICIIPEGI